MTDARSRPWLVLAGPPILFGLRLSAAVALALFVALWLELENPSWAGTSASIVCQPVLGMSLRKGVFRLVGTVVGAVATVLLTACFPQDRAGFLLGMAFWCAACSFVSTMLRNFAAYAAMLAGYTMAIIASSSIAQPDQVFTLALSRATEIGLGIVCGMIVMSLTDSGRSADRLTAGIAGLMRDIGAGILQQIEQPGAPDAPFRTRRQALIRRVVALDPLLDQTIAESPAASGGRATIRAGIQGLFSALAAWRALGIHLARLAPDEAESQARIVREHLPARIESLLAPGGSHDMLGHAGRCFGLAERCRSMDVETPSLRLGADRLASVLDGLGRAANAAALLSGASEARSARPIRRSLLPDILPPLVNGARVFVAVGSAALFYIATAWPDGPTFLTFLTVTVILQSPRDERAFSAAVGFGFGMLLTAAVAGVVKFAVLPNHDSFAFFALVVAMALVPMAALSTVPTLAPVFVAATTNFVPLLGPANQITYDPTAFSNTALAILSGSIAGAAVLRIAPPVPPRVRAARLLGLTLRDFRRLAQNPDRWRPDPWRARVYGRLLALPPEAELEDGSRLLAALTAGLQWIDLRAAAHPPADASLLRSVGAAMVTGQIAKARRGLAELREAMADRAPKPAKTVRLRLEAVAQELSETLGSHADYFGAEVR